MNANAAGLGALTGLVSLVPGTMAAYAAALAAVTVGTFRANRAWAFAPS